MRDSGDHSGAYMVHGGHRDVMYDSVQLEPLDKI